MNLKQHPEYDRYLQDQAYIDTVRGALLTWFDEHENDQVAWETAVSRLTALFHEYNQVMWQAFPFCQMCLGGCCVVDASEVTAIDAAALIVLGHDLPVLPAQTHHNARACIYLGAKGCAWPANWRPLKCMTFYSLGSGDWQLEASDDRYDRLSDALQTVMAEFLPNLLPNTHTLDPQALVEPIAFAAAFSQQLAQQYLPPDLRQENSRSSLPSTDPSTTALFAIAALYEQVVADPPPMADQLLADLEQFEWIVNGQPTHVHELLAEINGRYASQQQTHPLYKQFRQQIQLYLEIL